MADAIDALAASARQAQRLASLSIGVRRIGRGGAPKAHGDGGDVTRSVGLADLENQVAATPRSVYRIGSLTKLFTAAAVMRLIEQGQLQLADMLGYLLPECPPPGREITIEQLLTHTSGIVNYTALPEFTEKSRLDLTHRDLGRLVANHPLQFNPGARFAYSNSNYYLLGVVIELVSGLAYHDYMQRTLFAPLALSDTHYLDDYRVIKGRVRGYDQWHGITINTGQLSMTSPFAAGGLGSCVGDLLAWGEALITGKVVDPASLVRMSTPPALHDGGRTTYGYGMVVGNLDGRRKWFHGETINGFRSQLALYPDEGIVVAVLCNTGGAAVDIIETHVSRWALGLGAPAVAEVTLSRQQMSTLTGEYELETGSLDVRLAEGELTLGGAPMRPIGPDQFVLGTDLDTRITFTGIGSAARVLIEREGQLTEGQRLAEDE